MNLTPNVTFWLFPLKHIACVASPWKGMKKIDLRSQFLKI
jgi:hypothetical protein